MDSLTEERPVHPGASISIFVATLFLGFLILGPLIGFFIALPFYEGSFFSLSEEIMNGSTSEAIRLPFFIMQGTATAIGLIVIPMLVFRFMVRMNFFQLVHEPISFLPFAVTAMTVIAFMFPNSIIIEWNANLNFDGPFWNWARELELRGEVMTNFLTDFQSPIDFVIAFLVIAVLPALGEEFAFRGWLQPAIQKLSGNPHLAIWITAFMFSAFHFQFFGFVPRMLLGAMFGYMMYWSNNLWLPIVAHFVNNGFSVLMLYLNQLKIVEFDASSNEALPMSLVIPFSILFLVLMVYLKKIIPLREKTT
jgi:uncharacterized protein